MKILILEDDKLTLHALQHTIEGLGHTAAIAENGEKGITMAIEGNFDLILCDIMMPGISGLSLVSILRVIHLCTMPIIMMSVLHNKPLLNAAFEAGADDFLEKPISITELQTKLEKFDHSKNKL